MSYAIMRCAKLSTGGSVSSSLQHCFRERVTENANGELTHLNEHSEAQNVEQALERMQALLPEKRRKDAVLMVEYVMTASPEWWQKASAADQADFFKNARDWLDNKYGKDRVVVATIHRDETSPHMSAYVVPLTKDGRLSAKEFIGNRTKMKDDQTTFAKQVQHLGLKRGIEGSKAKHRTIKEFYSEANKIENPEIPDLKINEKDLQLKEFQPTFLQRLTGFVGSRTGKKVKLTVRERLQGVKETQKGVAKRINDAIHRNTTPLAKKAATASFMASRVKELEKERLHLQQKLEPFKGMSQKQIRQAAQTAKENKQNQELSERAQRILPKM